jgi:hypothetical protein
MTQSRQLAALLFRVPRKWAGLLELGVLISAGISPRWPDLHFLAGILLALRFGDAQGSQERFPAARNSFFSRPPGVSWGVGLSLIVMLTKLGP